MRLTSPVIHTASPYIPKKLSACLNVSCSGSFCKGVENALPMFLNPNTVLTARKGNTPTMRKLGISTNGKIDWPAVKTPEIIPNPNNIKETI
jgi:hypothetical protein